MKAAKWKKIEVLQLITDEPETVYKLPSGFSNLEIKVYEDPSGVLEATYIMKKEKRK